MREITILDGGTSAYFDKEGFVHEDPLESFILESPDKLIKLQKEFIAGGSKILLTPTLTSNPAALEKYGLAQKCGEINRALAQLTYNTARAANVTIAGDIGPCKNYMREDPFSFTEMISLYEKQVQALDKFADMYFIETMTALDEIRAAVIACRKTKKPVFVSIRVDEDARTFETHTSALSIMLCVQELGIDAFGFNCSPGSYILNAIREIMPYAKLPVIAKPCGLIGNTQLTPAQIADEILESIDAGASIVGGCRGTYPEHIAAISEAVKNYTGINVNCAQYQKQDCALCFSGYGESYFLDPDTTEISEPLKCHPNMQEEITDICEQNYDVLCVLILTPEDAADFAKNAQYATLPVMFTSNSQLALKTALMLYQGRALIDRESQIESDALEKISRKYGAVIY